MKQVIVIISEDPVIFIVIIVWSKFKKKVTTITINKKQINEFENLFWGLFYWGVERFIGNLNDVLNCWCWKRWVCWKSGFSTGWKSVIFAYQFLQWNDFNRKLSFCFQTPLNIKCKHRNYILVSVIISKRIKKHMQFQISNEVFRIGEVWKDSRDVVWYLI